METQRANRCVSFFEYCSERGYSSMSVIAALSIVLLAGAVGYQLQQSRNAGAPIAGTEQPYASSTDVAVLESEFATTSAGEMLEVTEVGAVVLGELAARYASLQAQGIYSPAAASQAAVQLAQELKANVPYKTYSTSDIPTDNDTSYARMLRYREDLQTSLRPLLDNKEPEFEIFGRYVQTNDAIYLAQLRTVANNYTAAADATARLRVPKDAVPYHVGLLNALSQLSATLISLAEHAPDPFAAPIALRAENSAEMDLLAAFKALVSYQKSKLP